MLQRDAFEISLVWEDTSWQKLFFFYCRSFYINIEETEKSFGILHC